MTTKTKGPKPKTVAERYWAKVDLLGPFILATRCWIWTATINKRTGYGQLQIGTWREPRLEYAHRIGWELAYGPIPEGMTVDHLCRNRACQRPTHFELVTLAENGRRGANARWHP